MLLGIKADKVVIEKEGEEVEKDNIVIGIYGGRLSEKNDYDAVASPGTY